MKINIDRSRICRYILIAAVIGIIKYAGQIYYTDSFEEMFDKAYGFINFSGYDKLAGSFLLWFVPEFAIIVCLGNYIERELISNISMVITRSGKTRKLLLYRCIELMIYTAAICIVFYCSLYILYGIFNQFAALSGKTLTDMAVYLAHMYAAVLVLNLMSVFIKPYCCVAVIIIGQLIEIYIIKSINDGLIAVSVYKLLPLSAVMFDLNTAAASDTKTGLIYLLILTAAVFEASVYLMRKKDFV